MTRRYFSLVTCLALVLGVTRPAGAEEIAFSADQVFKREPLKIMELPNGTIVVRQVFSGFFLADDPKNPLHLSQLSCIGSFSGKEMGPNGFLVSWTGSGFCDLADADGDLAWTVWQGKTGVGTARYIGGTGKYEGLEGSSEWKDGHIWPDGTWTNRISGTIRMK
jgi:hypothetical protein